MLSDYVCECGKKEERYYPSSNLSPNVIECTCGKKMKRLVFGSPRIRMGKEVSGYENDDFTVGKLVDSKQKWV